MRAVSALSREVIVELMPVNMNGVLLFFLLLLKSGA